MEKNYMICHKDITELGYYFLDREQEERYLKSINDEFALRVGDEIIRRIPPDKQSYIFSLPGEDMLDYIKKNMPDIDETVKEIRENLLKELRENRKTLLMKGLIH